MSVRCRIVGRIAILAITLVALCPLIKIYIEVGGIWLCRILKWEFSTPIDQDTATLPRDIVVSLILVCGFSAEQADLSAVLAELHDLASDHVDSDSVCLKTTLACRYGCCDSAEFSILGEWCRDRLGEMELLLPCDTLDESSYRDELRRGLAFLGSAGRTGSVEPGFRFAAVRVRCDHMCENTRLQQLRALEARGCYADMSFPDVGFRGRPTGINAIYSISSADPDPFGHCKELRTGRFSSGGVVVVDGPLLIDWTDWRDWWGPFVEDGRLTSANPPDSGRAESWIRANVHVIGQPSWIFVKLKIVEVPDSSSVQNFAQSFDRTLTYLEDKYSDNGKYRLHYVTAREMYNIARAAEAGWTGDAGGFRDHEIAPYDENGEH